jgi:hypothetical protein
VPVAAWGLLADLDTESVEAFIFVEPVVFLSVCRFDGNQVAQAGAGRGIGR